MVVFNWRFFSLKVDFLTPMIFRILAAAELGCPALAETASNSFAVPVLSPYGSTGIPKMLKLHWLKSTFAKKLTG
jgi:hypothetical protein